MKKVKNYTLMFVKIFIVGFISWFILNPSFARLNVVFALLIGFLSSSCFIAVAGHFISENILDFLFKKNFYKYLKFMLKEIAVSSYDVLKSVFQKKAYEGVVVTIPVPTHQNISQGKMLLITSSIALTPGTSVISVDDKNIYVHCLLEGNKSIQNGDFVNKVLSFKF